jgi:hypothetical protein
VQVHVFNVLGAWLRGGQHSCPLAMAHRGAIADRLIHASHTSKKLTTASM